MAFPQDLDALVNPSSGSNTVTVSHAANHTAANDAIEAIETKLGVNNSAVNTTIDYKLTNGSSVNPGHKHTLAAALTDVNVSSVVDGEVLIYNSGEGKWKNASTDAPDSSTTVKGVVKLAEAPAVANNPIAVGTNDSRFTTLSSGALNGSSNKIVDQASVTEAKTASKIPIRDANSDILVATTPTAGDAAASKTYTDTKTLRHKCGVLSVNNNEATVTSTLTCGFTPKIIRIHAMSNDNTFWSVSSGSWNATDGERCAYKTSAGNGTSTTYIFYINATNNAYYIRGEISNVTSTTFDLVITSNNSDNITGVLVWDAEGQE